MKTVNFNVPIKLLDGTNMSDGIKDATMANIVANMLVQAKAGKDPVRQLNTAFSIVNAKEAMELEDADFNMVKDVVEKSGASVILVGHILKVLGEAK